MEIDIINKLVNKEFRVVKIVFNEKNSLFTLDIQGEEEDFILNQNGSILFFKDLTSLKKFLKKNFLITLDPKYLDEMVDECLLPDAISYIKTKNAVENSWLLDTLNTLIGCAKETKERLPKNIKRILFDFADHLTFNLTFAEFFKLKNNNRQALLKAVFFCVGIITCNSKIEN